jgi:hypothetical protein
VGWFVAGEDEGLLERHLLMANDKTQVGQAKSAIV